jgi:hypothetical protein
MEMPDAAILKAGHRDGSAGGIKACGLRTGTVKAKGCETSRLEYFLESRLADGSEIVSLNPPFFALYLPGDSWY